MMRARSNNFIKGEFSMGWASTVYILSNKEWEGNKVVKISESFLGRKIGLLNHLIWRRVKLLRC